MQYANAPGLHNNMQSKEHCTVCKLHAVRERCTVYNTHAERVWEETAEWVMFETDLMNGDSLSPIRFLRFGHCVNMGSSRIASQRQCCQEMPSL